MNELKQEKMGKLSYRVLLVEDNEDDYLIVRDLVADIATADFELEWVDNYQAAREILARRQHDVCLMDYGLGEASGMELIREFGQGEMPFILLTGREDYQVDVAATKAGASDYLIKGHINPLLLERAIRYAIQRAQSEAAVLASEVRYRRVFESAFDGILILDAGTGKITDVNPYLIAMLEYSREEFMGRELWELGLMTDAKASVEAFAKLQTDGYIRYDNLPLESKSGKCYEVEFVSNVYTEGGRQVVQCNIRDITDRKQAQESERESQRFLQSTLDALSSHIAVLDEAGTIIAVNAAWRQFAEDNDGGIACGVGTNYLEICGKASGVSAEEAPAVAEGIRAVIASREATFTTEYPCHSPAQQRWFNVRMTRFIGEGPVRIVVAHENITERKQAENDLRDSNEKFYQLVDNIDDVFWIRSADMSELHYVSPAFERIWGRSLESLHASPDQWTDFVLPQDRERVQMAFAEGTSNASGVDIEYRIARPDGEIRWVRVRGFPVRDANDQVVRHTGIVTDTTDRKQAEDALQASEAEFRTLTEAMPQMVWITRPDGWNIYFSQQWIDYTGLTLEESLGHGWNKPFHPDDQQRARDAWQQATTKTGTYSIETRLRRADGVYRWYLVRGVPQRDAAGNILKWFGTCTDIHDLRMAEEERDRFFTLSLDMLVITDSDGYFKRLNPSWESTLGFSDTELMAVPFVEFVHPDDLAGTLAKMANLAKGIEVMQFENRYRCRDGSYKWLQWMSAPYEDTWYCVAHDVTGDKEAAAALMESEERFRQMAESVDEVFWLFNPVQEKLLYVSPSFEKIWGLPSQSFLDQTIRYIDTVYPDDRDRILADRKRQGESNDPCSEEYRIVRPDGTMRWVWVRTFPIHNQQGEVYRIAAIAQDITARKEAEDALSEANNVLEVRVEERTAALQHANAETRTRARQQEAVAELGQRALSNVDMDTLLTVSTALVTKTLDVEISSILELLPSGDTMRIHASTGWRADIVNQVVSDDADSQAGYTLLSNLPVVVTNLRSETRFRPSPRFLEEGIVSGITVVVGSHEQPYGTLGAFTRQQRSFTQDDTHFLQAMANVLAAALEQRRTKEQLRIENIERQMALRALQDSAAVLQESKDQAENSRAEAERANLAKSEFLSRMSHELRTPLNAILGFGQILEMRGANGDAQDQDNVQQILKAGRHLLALINEVLDIARIEAGYLSLSTEPIAIGSFIRETLNLARPLATARRILVVNEVEEQLSAKYVLADQQRLKQVLLNLLSNAVKYNRDEGQIVVSCRVLESGPVIYDGIPCVGRLRVQVRDTGAGIAPQDIARLFIPFERLEAASSQIEGTGIGLSICKPLIEAMHGQIGVESEVGQGSAFWLELPLVPGVPAHSLPHPDDAEIDLGATSLHAPIFDGSRTILYIEDNLSNINLIEHVLSDFSSQVQLITAMQGSLGLDLATHHHPNLILLDAHLPDLMGDVVLNRLKANRLTQDIPVIVLSADATPRQIERYMALGAVCYLTKPLDINGFLETIGAVFNDTAPVQDKASTPVTASTED